MVEEEELLKRVKQIGILESSIQSLRNCGVPTIDLSARVDEIKKSLENTKEEITNGQSLCREQVDESESTTSIPVSKHGNYTRRHHSRNGLFRPYAQTTRPSKE